jgi:hypothetical protein
MTTETTARALGAVGRSSVATIEGDRVAAAVPARSGQCFVLPEPVPHPDEADRLGADRAASPSGAFDLDMGQRLDLELREAA